MDYPTAYAASHAAGWYGISISTDNEHALQGLAGGTEDRRACGGPSWFGPHLWRFTTSEGEPGDTCALADMYPDGDADPRVLVLRVGESVTLDLGAGGLVTVTRTE